jgi:hypothetical protein
MNGIAGLMEATEKLKREALIDLLRRVVANMDKPRNLEQVAEAIARDWSPPMRVDEHGRLAVDVGDAKHSRSYIERGPPYAGGIERSKRL